MLLEIHVTCLINRDERRICIIEMTLLYCTLHCRVCFKNAAVPQFLILLYMLYSAQHYSFADAHDVVHDASGLTDAVSDKYP